MRFKTTFIFLCLVLVLLSIGVFDVHASSACVSYYTAYQGAVDAYKTALEALQRAEVLYRKAIPGSFPIPSNLKHLEEEYNADPDAFFKKVKEVVYTHPNIRKSLSKTQAFLNAWLDIMDMSAALTARSDARDAYDAAKTAVETNKKALENCTGVTVVTIWCERGADCKKQPGVQGNPKAHFNFKCPNYIRGGFNLAIACPGTWWSCEGVGQCPKRFGHLSDEDVAKSKVVDPNSATASLSGSSTATAGSTYQIDLTTPSAYRSVYWYVKSPSESGLGTQISSVIGGSSSTTASLSWSIPSSASAGDHVITAYVYNDSDNSVYEVRHTVSVAAAPKPKPSASVSGSGSAKAGSRYKVSLTTTVAFRYMYWYVKAPGGWGKGNLVSAWGGGRRSSSLSYPFASSASGDYVITASVKFYDGSVSEVRHTVSVEKQTPVVKKEVTPVSKPTETQPKDTTPTDTTPKKENPPLTTPKDTTPKDTTPKETTPKDTTPKETQPQPKPSRPTAVCSAGHTYYTDAAYARNRHKDRTCTRCSLTYQNCTNHSSACQNSKWHTEDPSAKPKTTTTPKPTTPKATYHPCGLHLSTESGNHDLVYCPTQGGKSCLYGSYWACQGEHTHKYESVPQAPTTPTTPQATYHACGIHLSSVSGDHSLQASCSETNSNGDRCTVTSFYACQSHTHQYPAPPPKPKEPEKPKSACPADSVTNCGGSSSHGATCSAGHSYYTCNSSANSYHKDRTCTRCGNTYQGCTNSSSACQGSKWHTENAIAKIKCGASGWTGCTTSVSSSSEHRTTCSGGHSYWTCGTANDWHKDRTCTRCSQTYQKCTNTSTSCQGNKWHTGG